MGLGEPTPIPIHEPSRRLLLGGVRNSIRIPGGQVFNRFITSDSTQTLHQLPAPTSLLAPATTTTRIMLCICCPILLYFSSPRDTSGVVTPSSFLKDMPKRMSATAISDNGADCSAKGPKPSFKSVNQPEKVRTLGRTQVRQRDRSNCVPSGNCQGVS